MAKSKPTLVDLFAGCGGVALGFHDAGFETLFANEMHPDPAETYRKNLLVGSCLIWSLASIISGSTESFWILCAMRFITGACVSATDPAAYSILGDYFPRNMRSTANSLLNTGHYLGAGFASLIVLAVSQFGWRASYIYLGIFSALAGIFTFFTVKEPERGIQLKLAYQEQKLKQT